MAYVKKRTVGGRRAQTRATQQTQQQAQQQAQQTQQQIQQAMDYDNYPQGFSDPVDGVYVDLNDTYNDWLYGGHASLYKSGLNDVMKQYISQTDAGQGYSMSQWLNFKLNNNMPLNANEKYMIKQINAKAYALGQNANLFRADHDDELKRLGIKDYTQMSGAQLKKALVGKTYTNKQVLSTSYDKNTNPFYHNATKSNSGVSGGREIYYNYKVKSNVRVVQGDRSQTEVAIAPNANFRITDVRYDNSTATPRNSSSKRRLIVDVEVY